MLVQVAFLRFYHVEADEKPFVALILARRRVNNATLPLMIQEDLIAAAFNDAARRIEETQKEKMASVSNGMQLPPGFKMPF